MVDIDLEAAAEMMWNLHTQTRPWVELSNVEQDQIRDEARAVVLAALGVEDDGPEEQPATEEDDERCPWCGGKPSYRRQIHGHPCANHDFHTGPGW